MSGYDNWLQRPTGALDDEREVRLPTACKCGATEGLAVTTGYGEVSVTCEECGTDHTEQFEDDDR